MQLEVFRKPLPERVLPPAASSLAAAADLTDATAAQLEAARDALLQEFRRFGSEDDKTLLWKFATAMYSRDPQRLGFVSADHLQPVLEDVLGIRLSPEDFEVCKRAVAPEGLVYTKSLASFLAVPPRVPDDPAAVHLARLQRTADSLAAARAITSAHVRQSDSRPAISHLDTIGLESPFHEGLLSVPASARSHSCRSTSLSLGSPAALDALTITSPDSPSKLFSPPLVSPVKTHAQAAAPVTVREELLSKRLGASLPSRHQHALASVHPSLLTGLFGSQEMLLTAVAAARQDQTIANPDAEVPAVAAARGCEAGAAVSPSSSEVSAAFLDSSQRFLKKHEWEPQVSVHSKFLETRRIQVCRMLTSVVYVYSVQLPKSMVVVANNVPSVRCSHLAAAQMHVLFRQRQERCSCTGLAQKSMLHARKIKKH